MAKPGSRAPRVGPRSLAARITFLTFAVITTFALVAAVLALLGVSRMARQESQARLAAYNQVIAEGIEQRLSSADRVMDAAGRTVAKSQVPPVLRPELLQVLTVNKELFDIVAVVDSKGRLVESVPNGVLPADSVGQAYFLPSIANTVYVWQPASKTRDARPWMVHPVKLPGDKGVILVIARLRTDFIDTLVNYTSSSADNRAAFVLDPNQQPVAVGDGSPKIDLAAISYSGATIVRGSGAAASGTEARQGDIQVAQPALGLMRGLYTEIYSAGRLLMKVGVAEPDSLAFERSGGALIPAGVVVFLGALVFAVAAAFFARRATEPIREFEARARDVSAGAYVRPLVVDRDDEIGAMATAFNTMASRINMLQDVSQLLASSSETDHVLDGIISATAHLLRTGSVAVFLIDEEHRSLQLARASGLRREAGGLQLPVASDSVISRAFTSDGPLTFVADAMTAEDDPALAAFGIGTARSGVAMPLVAGRETLGVVVVVSPGRREFTEADIEMIKTFSAQAAVAVRNSRLFSEEHVSRQEAEALRAVAELLVSSLDPTASLEQVGRIASSLIGVDRVLFAFGDRTSLDLRAADDRPREVELLGIMNNWAMRSGQDPAARTPVVVDDAVPDPVMHDYADRYRVGSVMLVPLVAGGTHAGVMAFETSSDPHPFTNRQISLAVTIGNEVSLALENQYLLTRERSRAASLERIFRISQAVSSSLQVKTVLNRVLDVVQKIFSADAVSLMRFDAKKRMLDTTMARGIHTKDLLFFRCGPADDIPGAVYQSKAPLRLDSLDSQSTPFIELAREHGFRSLLSVPLIARGRAAGVLTVFSAENGAFTEEDMDLLATFASQAALATDTAELFGKEHTVATVLKSSILPDTLPEIPGIEAFSLYRAAGGEAEIGGDYYDMFTASDDRVVLSIADVCGQGVRAATKTSMIRYSVRGMGAAGLQPNRMASELNRMVAESGDTSDIVTALIGLLDREKCTFLYANAGHPPGLLVRDGQVTPLETTGPLLGAIAGIVYQQVEVALEPGDLIVLYTDGVTEARSEGELYGEARLRAVVAEGGSPAEVTQRILSAVQSFSGELRDDVAVLAVRFTEGTTP